MEAVTAGHGAALGRASAARRSWDDPAFQAFTLLRLAFTAAPILFGIDKFASVMVDWEIYLAPWLDDIVPGTAEQAMYAVGAIEIVAGIAVALKPRYAPTWWRRGSRGSSSTCSPTRATTTSRYGTSA